ncbi:MAG TPA: hypothetical protein DD381_05240 [Lentisphaeria bacterium]|nr:MAG: hypothetical protein A2X47_06175 [Lentisphaerae bacterium GWF2_38_69]HBM15736.1 hypothetical protein [Lentisphaeria bacterium]
MRAINLFIKTVIVILILIVIAYFIVTSSFFIKKVLLPIVEYQTKGTVALDSVNLSPLKGEIEFGNLNLDTENFKAKIKRFECRFNLFDCFTHKINVSKLVLEDSYISIVSKVSSVGGLPVKKHEPETKTVLASNPINLNIRNVSIINFNLKYSVTRDNASEDTVSELKNFNLAIPYFEMPGKARAEFTSNVITSAGDETLTGFIQGKLNATFNDKSIPKELVFDSSLKLGDNVSPLSIKFNSENELGKTPFEMSAELSNLPLQPFFQTFLKGDYKKTNGYINNFQFKANGADMTSINNLEGMDGIFSLSLSNVYIPMELENNQYIGLIFLPLNVIGNLDKSISTRAFNNSLTNVLDISNSVLHGSNILECKSGEVRANISNGNININKFLFLGTQSSAVKMMDITGAINKDQSIDIQTKTNLSGIVIPIHITGTLKNPKPDTVSLVNSMVQNTAQTVGNIIGTATNNNNVKNTTNSIINAVDTFTGSQQSNDNDNTVGNLLNSVKQIGK